MEKPDFLPGIQEYLEQADNSKSVSASGLDDLIYKVVATTGLEYDGAKIIVKLFFQEMRNAALRGDMVFISDFGKFFIASPKIGKNKKRVFVKFKPHAKLLKKLNG